MIRSFTVMTLAGLLMAILMSVLSAYIRLAESGIDCEPWPACHLSSFTIDTEPGITIGDDDRFKALRGTHRFMASAFGLLSVLMLVMAFWYRRELRVVTAPVLVFVVMLVLAWVGMRTPDLRHPVVMLTNLVGGMALGALLLWQYLQLRGQTSIRLPSLGLLLIVLVGIASGSWVNANFAMSACPAMFDCSASMTVSVFDLGRELSIQDHLIERSGDEAGILILHLVLGLLVVIGAFTWCVSRYLRERKFHAWIIVPTGVLLALGFLELIPASGVRSVAAASLHNLMALVLLLAVTFQVFGERREV